MLKVSILIAYIFLPSALNAAPLLSQEEIQQIQIFIQHNQVSTDITLASQTKIKRFLPMLVACIQQENDVIETFHADQLFLNQNNKMSNLNQQQIFLQKKIMQHQQQLNHCQYLKDKLSLLDIHMQKIRYDNYHQTLFVRQENIINAFHHTKPNFLAIWHAIKTFISQTSLLKHFQFLGLLFGMYFLYYQFYPVIKSPKKSLDLSVKNSLFIIGLLLFTDPVLYHSLASHFGNHFFLWATFYSRAVIAFLFVMIFLFYLTHLHLHQPRRELSLLLLGFCHLAWIGAMIFQGHLIDKYLCLLALPSLSVLLIYFIFFRILASIKIAGIEERRLILWLRSKLIILACIFLSLFIFGAIGFIDMAITYWLGLLLGLILLIWFFIFKMMIDNFLLQSKNKAHWLGQFMHNYMVMPESGTLVELRVLKACWLFGASAIIILILWTSFYLPSDVVINTYDLFFKNQALFDKNLIIINVLRAMGSFLVLNLINRFLSKYLANYCASREEDILKYQHMFFILGIFFAFILSLSVSNLYMESIVYILGGLALGAGVGLQDVLANFCAGIYLIYSRPFAKGDLVTIGDNKGTIKKIALMETTLESLEKVIFYMPNMLVLKLMMRNHFNSKIYLPRLKFQFELMNLDSLEDYKILILDILAQEKQLQMKGQHQPEFLLFIKDGVYELELICAMTNLSKMKQVLSCLTESFIRQTTNLAIKLKNAYIFDEN